MRDMGAVEEDERMEEGRRDMERKKLEERERERCSRGGARRIEERN